MSKTTSAVLLVVVALVMCACSVLTLDQPSVNRVVPLLSNKYKYVKELAESLSTLQLEIQVLKADSSTSAEDKDLIAMKKENVQEMERMLEVFEKEISAMERVVLRDGSMRTCLDISRAIRAQGKNATTGEYPLVDKDYIKKTVCSFEDVSTQMNVQSSIVSRQAIMSVSSSVPSNMVTTIDGMSVIEPSTNSAYSDLKRLFKPSLVTLKGLRDERGVISKKVASSEWDASFFTKEAINDNTPYQGITFKAGQNNLILVVGLSMKEIGTTNSDMMFSLYLNSDSNYYVYEKGSNVGAFGRYEEGDEFRIGVCMTNMVCYYYNGKVFYTSRFTAQYPLYIDSSFYNNGARILDLAFYEPLNTDPKSIETGQAVYFKNVRGCLTSAGFVKKTYASSSFDSGVSSTLRIGETFTSTTLTKEEKDNAAVVGGFSFKVGETMQQAVFGLANEDTTYSPSEIKFGIQLHPSGFVYIYERGESFGPLQSYFKGDVFSIQLIKEETTSLYNNRVIYIHNSQPFYLSRNTATLPMIVDVSMASQFASAYDFTWTARYEREQAKIAEGEMVIFPFLRGLSFMDGVLTKIYRTDGFNGFASTNFTITQKPDARGLAFKINQNNIAIAIGLTSTENDEAFKHIEFGIYFKADKTISVIDATNVIDNMGFYDKGDKFSVFVNSEGKVVCSQNDEAFFTSQNVAKFPLKILSCFQKMEGSISNIMYVSESGILTEAPQAKIGTPVYWKHVHGMKSKPGYQRKSLTTEGWNAGSFSVHSITSNSIIGGITFKPAALDKNIMIGLTSSKSHTSYQGIDMVISLSGNQYSVYEKGSSKGAFGTFNINDRFEISISQDNSQIVFLYNDVIFYTNQAPSLPLYVDNSFYSSDSCLFDIMFTGKYAFNQSEASVGSPVYFKNIIGLDVSKPGRIIKAKESNGWDAIAFSTVGIPSPKAESVNKQVYGIYFLTAAKKNSFVSLSNVDSKDLNQDYGFKFTTQGGISIMERGSTVYNHNKAYQVGDKFSIYLSNGVVTYSMNDDNIYSSKKAPNYPLGVGVAIYEPGIAIDKLAFITNENEPPKKLIPNQKVYWKYFVGCSVDPGFVFKHTDSNSLDAFTTSSLFIDTQSSVTNYQKVGGFSFKATSIPSYIGLTDVIELGSVNSLQYSIYLDGGYIYVFERGQMKGAFHTYVKDDEFSIRITTNYDKTKQNVVYSHNGNVFYSSQYKDNFILPSQLYVGTALQKSKSGFVDITWVTTFEPEEAAFVNVLPGTPISNFSNIIGLERLGGVGTTRTIRRNRPSSDAGFYTSRKYITEKGKVDGISFKTLYNNFGIQIGFTIVTDIKFGLYLRSDRTFSILDSGSDLGVFGEYSENDEFSLVTLPTGKMNERTFVFLKNGMIIYANPKKVYMGPFGVSANFIHSGGAISDLTYVDSSKIGTTNDFKSNSLMQWESAALSECKDGQAFKTISSDSWNSGVISRYEFVGDDEINGVSFIASQPSGQTLVVGLNHEPDGSFSIAGIDHALYLSYNQVSIYENNNKVSTETTSFKRGDNFEIKVVNGIVYYTKNGNIFYTSKVSPKFPLKVQASFYSSASQITDVKWISKPSNK